MEGAQQLFIMLASGDHGHVSREGYPFRLLSDRSAITDMTGADMTRA